MKERLIRLGFPLIFGMLVIVPPQVYFERLVDETFTGSYFNFLTTVAYHGIYPEGNISWHHLWFLPYLLIFSLLLTPVFIYLRNNPGAGILMMVEKVMSLKYGWYLFAIPLIVAEIFLEPFFDETHALIGDWFALTNYVILFFYGYLFVKIGDRFWMSIGKIKFTVFCACILLFGCYIAIRQLDDGLIVHCVEGILKVFNFWSWILVLFAYSAQWFNRKSKLLSYCNTAVYPFYIFHQTVTVSLAYYMINWEVGFLIKFLILSLGTFLISWLLYEIIRRSKITRPLFGLK